MALKKLLLPGLAVTALAGGTIAFFLLNRTASHQTTPLAIAKVLPDEAYLATFISTDEKNWEKLKKFGTPEAQKAFEKSFQKMRADLLKDSKIDLDQDLKPWMGNMMVAFLPGEKQDKAEVVTAIAIKDKVSALNFANKVKSNAKTKTVETEYKGVKVLQIFAENGKDDLHTAVLNDAYLVMASNRSGIEQSIEAMKGSGSFASSPEAASLLSQKESGEAVIARVYMPISAMTKAMSADPKMDAAVLKSLNQLQSVTGTVSITDVGLKFQGAVKVDPKIAIAFKPAPGKIASLFPADTFALMSGSDLNSFWTQIAEQSKTNADAKKTVDLMRGTSQMIGLDLDKDIFGWMNGEFAIGMIPVNQGMMAQVGFGQAMVFQTRDRTTAESTLGKLDQLAKSQSLSIAQREMNGKKITQWQTPQGAVLGHGWLNDNTLLIAMGDPIIASFSSQPNPALDTNDNFKTVMAALPKQNTGYFYMDMPKLMTLMNKISPNKMEPESRAILESIQGIGSTTTQVDKTTSQIEAIVTLKPAK